MSSITNAVFVIDNHCNICKRSPLVWHPKSDYRYRMGIAGFVETVECGGYYASPELYPIKYRYYHTKLCRECLIHALNKNRILSQNLTPCFMHNDYHVREAAIASYTYQKKNTRVMRMKRRFYATYEAIRDKKNKAVGP